MKSIVVEIDGKRHRLVEDKNAQYTGCRNCSLKDLCLAEDIDVMFCKKVNDMFGDEDADYFSLCFKLEKDERRKT